MDVVSTRRAVFGAATNRLQTTVSNLRTMFNNMQAANSAIRDVDVVVLTGGTNNNNQFRFGIFSEEGNFVSDDPNNWVGGWLHSSGSAASSERRDDRCG